MPDIIKVDPTDKYRTLLTEVLPYELPLWMNNFTMYRRFKNENHSNTYQTISGLDFGKDSGTYIPLDFLVSRGGDKSPRAISIMHPVAQLKVCDFYDEYADLIEYYCTRSKYSLRHPFRKSTKFYGKTQEASKLVEGVESADEERVVSSSYFKYNKYPFLYRFFESYEYHKLEKRFHSMLQVDVAKCFPSIYTHSIGWAIKGKRLAKARAKSSFDGDFDNLMQITNYRETNGIIIGPETSRIFAEIILQKVDLNLVERLKKKNIEVSKDYDFRRYVDDYFVFFRSDEVKTAFINALEYCLLEYKMYLNEAKTTIVSRPFATDISLAKYALRHSIDQLYTSRYRVNDEGTHDIIDLRRPESKANKAIAEIKMALAIHKTEYHSISNYLFSAITKKMANYLSKLDDINGIEESHLNWLLVDLDLLFFVHAMDIRIRPTDRLARTVHELAGKLDSWPDSYKELVHKKIFDHVRQAIDIFLDHTNDLTGLETLNLLMILTMLPPQYQLSETKLKQYIEKLEDSSETNYVYFNWITIMLYIGNADKYQALRDSLIRKAECYFTEHKDKFISTEYFIFYFDFLACPYIDQEKRKKVMRSIKKCTKKSENKPVNFNVIKQSSIVLDNDFVVSWRDKDYLRNSLEKREYIFSYN
ncbi:MAG: RNA-directed DNA polymerase [Pseudomonadales bacterium]|nr:RNA-directed DNA polymerase [Pseudomonadales bacterium]